MVNNMSRDTDFSHWKTKGEVAEILGVTERAVERMAASGKLRNIRYRTIPKRRAAPIYDPEEVAAVKREQLDGRELTDRNEASRIARVGEVKHTFDDEALERLVQQITTAVAQAQAQVMGPVFAQLIRQVESGQLAVAEAVSNGVDAMLGRLVVEAKARKALPEPANGEQLPAPFAMFQANATPAGEPVAVEGNKRLVAYPNAAMLEAIERKYLLTLREAGALGFRRRFLVRLIKAGKLTNHGTAAVYQVSRFELESIATKQNRMFAAISENERYRVNSGAGVSAS